jgi:hypothetical protein
MIFLLLSVFVLILYYFLPKINPTKFNSQKVFTLLQLSLELFCLGILTFILPFDIFEVVGFQNQFLVSFGYLGLRIVLFIWK